MMIRDSKTKFSLYLTRKNLVDRIFIRKKVTTIRTGKFLSVRT
ncbi:MAG: hypothetical protein PWR01_2675 [Clostridiales bacterium]|jgi:hypothetical protein|nr:hypothetical protein [Clostridiales bacterium]MDN5281602.1 hypothetical protein [Candidatus Ozemobacter sp.]